MFRTLPGYKSRVYFATVILEVFNVFHKRLLFEFCLQRRFRMQIREAELGKRSAVVSRTKGTCTQDWLPIKINFLFKQMGQTHVNKLFKLLLNSQGAPFKISTGCQIWCLITQSSRKVERTELWESLGDGALTGHQVSNVVRGAIMVPLMALCHRLTSGAASPAFVFSSQKALTFLGAMGWLIVLCLCPRFPGSLPWT